MLAQEIIRKKRDGLDITEQEINFLIDGMLTGSVTESQISSFAMAVFFQGMKSNECLSLTKALQESGDTLSWQQLNLPGPVIDKHSTGGIGDKVSLMLAPMLAACGAYIPMISGRGLGHSGGTLDKMDSIPGYNTSPSIEQFQQVVKEVGCAIVGQTADLAPADKQLYGIRDVTATVESIPLITASILSKKLSAGLDSLIMDVKLGSGAFNKSYEVAKALAENLVKVANGFGLPTSAILTDMSQALGPTVGNALEVLETADYLSGKFRDPRLHEVTLALGAEVLVLCKLHTDANAARAQLEQSLESGRAAQLFDDMVAALGGPEDFLNQADQILPKAEVVVPYYADISEAAYISKIDGWIIGNTVVALGGGRTRPQDDVNHAVGLSKVKGIGEKVSATEPVLMIHAQSESDAEEAKNRLKSAFSYDNEPKSTEQAVLETITLADCN